MPAADDSLDILVRIRRDETGAAQARDDFRSLGESGAKAHDLMARAAEEAGVAGETSHQMLCGPLGAGLSGATEGVRLLIEHFKKLDEQAAASAGRIAEAFGAAMKLAQDLREELVKTVAAQGQFNRQLDELAQKQTAARKEPDGGREDQETVAETNDHLRSRRAQATPAEELAKGAGASPEQLARLREEYARRGERAADIAAEPTAGDRFEQQVMAMLQARLPLSPSQGRAGDPDTVTAGRDALAQHRVSSKTLQDDLLRYLIANNGDLTKLAGKVQQLEARLKAVHNQ
jgi:DNA repair exonuclease SbcCD ATPase subunit